MTYRRNTILLSLLLLLFFSGCATKGLISDDYSETELLALTPDLEKFKESSPNFIIIGDSQPGERIVEDFIRKENLLTWKQALIPFYQLYLLGNGVVGGINHIRHVPDKGLKNRRLMRDRVYERAISNNADFVMMLGDIVGTDGRYDRHWEMFLEEYKFNHRFLNDIPVLPVVGNHEVANDTIYGFKNYESVFGMPRFYTVEFKDLVIYVLDSDYIIDQKDLIPDDIQEDLFKTWFVSENQNKKSWLEKELSSHDQKFKIIAMHHSPFMLGWHFKDWYAEKNGNDLVGKRKKLIDLLDKHNVQVVFSGHEHYYQHNVLKGKNDIHFIISSGGGVPIRALPSEQSIRQKLTQYASEGYKIEVFKQESVNHYTSVTIEDDTLKLVSYKVNKEESVDKILDTVLITH
jgi:Calcineurin-like phosphoesterase